MKTPGKQLGAEKKQFAASKIDENVWQQVLKIAEKNEDFKQRLRALGILDRTRQTTQEEKTIENPATVSSGQ